MKIGLIGLPLTGKTTVFNLLTGRSEETAAYGGGKRDAHLASIKVPDERLDRVARIYQPKKVTHAEIEFVDLAGFEMDQGGIESERLTEMRNLDALVHVLRFFESEAIVRAAGSAGALADATALEQELILTDLLIIEKRLEKLRSEIGKGRKELCPEQDLMERLAGELGEERALRSCALSESEDLLLRGYQLLSRLPIIQLANTDEDPAAGELEALGILSQQSQMTWLAMNAQAEWEISQLPEDERAAFYEDLGVTEPARDRFIRVCYDLMNLISFFTVGDEEVRAWTVRQDLPAVKAAGKVHSDMERGFIRAEVIAAEEFLALGSMAEARKQGVLRVEGKDYRVRDGEIFTVRFNV